MRRKRNKKKVKIERIEIINQKTGDLILEAPLPGALAFANRVADDRHSDDFLFIGIDSTGHTYDSWTLSEVLAGYMI